METENHALFGRGALTDSSPLFRWQGNTAVSLPGWMAELLPRKLVHADSIPVDLLIDYEFLLTRR